MKKIFTILFFFMFIDNITADSKIYISMKDYNINHYPFDCSFSLYDMNGNIVDSWVQGNINHFTSVSSGTYKLVEHPVNAMSSFDRVYRLDVLDDDVLEFVLYNTTIDPPDNLSQFNYFYYIGYIFIFIGLIFMVKLFLHRHIII